MVRNASKYPHRLHLWPKVLVKCLDMSYVTFIPTIVASVLPLATSRMRKCPIFAENSGFYENIAVRNGLNGSKQPERLHWWPKTLVNWSDVFYATFIPTIVYSVLPLAAYMSQNVKFWVWCVHFDLLRSGAETQNDVIQSILTYFAWAKSKSHLLGHAQLFPLLLSHWFCLQDPEYAKITILAPAGSIFDPRLAAYLFLQR